MTTQEICPVVSVAGHTGRGSRERARNMEEKWESSTTKMTLGLGSKSGRVKLGDQLASDKARKNTHSRSALS